MALSSRHRNRISRLCGIMYRAFVTMPRAIPSPALALTSSNVYFIDKRVHVQDSFTSSKEHDSTFNVVVARFRVLIRKVTFFLFFLVPPRQLFDRSEIPTAAQ